MRQWQQGESLSRNRKLRWELQLRRLANMRAAKARKRAQSIAEGWTPEPKMVRWFPLEFGVRDKRTGSTAWMDLRSTRDMAKRITVLLKHYV